MEGITKKATCIMFTDVVGYTRMMEQDELKTFEQIVHLRQMMDDLHTQNNGQLIQFIGDGSLSTFDCAEDAIHTAMQLRDRVPALLNLHLRIGLHYGTIIQKGEDTCGHAINLTSRIEDSAEQDSILMSDSIYEQLENPAAYEIQDQGVFRFKNVQKKVRLYAIEPENVGGYLVEQRVSRRFIQRWSAYLSSFLLVLISLLSPTSYFDRQGNQEDKAKCYFTCDSYELVREHRFQKTVAGLVGG